jgi:deazaflavin-dependent oxidoreductase (nitroreductase family)
MSFLAPLTTRVFNPLMRHVAGRVPGLGVLTHTGCVTGLPHRTPLLMFRRGDGYVVALWYGSDVHWVRNVVAAGGAQLRGGGNEVRVVDPAVFEDRSLAPLPAPLRAVGRLVGLSQFIRLRAA